MPRFHHANLGVPPGLEASEGSFLVDVLCYRKMDVPPDLQGRARWFEAEDGSQIHLSIDPEHRPAAAAHTAIEVDEAIEARLDAAGIGYQAGERDGLRVVFCDDPAGNRWELRRSV
jgi:catechol 2,3-dioxygenase-like lactoylglutathione lyase family enzyme